MSNHRIDNESRNTQFIGDFEVAGNLNVVNNATTAALKTNIIIANNHTLNLPTAASGVGYVLENDGFGNLTWVASGGGSATAIQLASVDITADMTLGTSSLYDVDASSGPVTLTLPPNASVIGRMYYILKNDATGNVVTIIPTSGESYNGVVDSAIILSVQYDRTAVMAINNGWFTMS